MVTRQERINDFDHEGTPPADQPLQILCEDHAPPGQLDEQIVVFSAPGESRECVEIIRRVLALAPDGVACDRIAVLLRSPQEYRSHLEEAFGRRLDILVGCIK